MKKSTAQQIDESLALSLINFSGGKLTKKDLNRFFKQDKFQKSPGITEHYKQYISTLADQLRNQL